jgi:hypothetical protein
MQVCPQCTHVQKPERAQDNGQPRRCPQCHADLPTEAIHSEPFDLPVPLRPLSAVSALGPLDDSLPVPLRPATDYRLERPKSAPPRAPQLQVVSAPDGESAAPTRQLPPPGVLPMLSIGPTNQPPATAAQITLPDSQGSAKAKSGSQPPSEPPDSRPQPTDSIRADRSTMQAKPIVLSVDPAEPVVAAPRVPEPAAASSVQHPATTPRPPSNPPSNPPSDSAQMGRLAARAGSTQSAKPISLTGRSPTPAATSQSSASSLQGDVPLSAMFSMAASRQSLASQTPQALKLGWVIAGLALAALLLLLTILVLVERSREAGQPLLPPTGSMQ